MHLAAACAQTNRQLDSTHPVQTQAQIVSLLAMLGIIFQVAHALPAQLGSILLLTQPVVAHAPMHQQLDSMCPVEPQARIVHLVAMLGIIYQGVLVSSAQ